MSLVEYRRELRATCAASRRRSNRCAWSS